MEPTNEAYAIAKIAGIKMCQAYRAQYGADFISTQPASLPTSRHYPTKVLWIKLPLESYAPRNIGGFYAYS